MIDRLAPRPVLVLVLGLAFLVGVSLFPSVSFATEEPSPPGDTAFESRCRAAVLDLHQWFEDWFNAKIPESVESLARFRDVLADDFQYVAAAGFLLDKAVIFEGDSWPDHGWWTEHEGGGETRVENFAFRRLSPRVALVTYEYWQDYGGTSRGRQDTAVFRLDESKPNGVVWLHVQETWLPDTEPEATE